MFLPFREGGKLGTFNYKQINPLCKIRVHPPELVTPLWIPHRFEPPRAFAFIAHRGSVTHGRDGGEGGRRKGRDVRVNAEILNVYISPSDEGGVTGVFARDREAEICSLSPGRELYARVDPFGQIAATNFKKNMSSPSPNCRVHPVESRARRYIRPPRRMPSFRRTLMRKISKRRSSSSLADPLNRQEWSRMPVLPARRGSIPFRTTSRFSST